MYLNLCFLSSSCNEEYNGTSILQIGPVFPEKLAKMFENSAKKCLTDPDLGNFPAPTQPKSYPTQPTP